MGELFRLRFPNDTSRRIVHVDMDAFYASIEMRDRPEYRKKALVIAHDPRKTGGKGVVTTANYVARQFGVHSAMPAQEALHLVPRELLVFRDPDFEKYRAVSAQIHQIFHQVSDLVQPVALDEAYIDVTANHDFSNSISLAVWLQRSIEAATHLTCAVGVSYNKFLAKMASEYNKPGGRTVVTPDSAQEFLADQPIGSFHGVGKKTLPKLIDMHITNGAELRAADPQLLERRFGKMGFVLAQHARGIDPRPVEVRKAKSIGKERTYNPPLQSDVAVKKELEHLAAMTVAAARKHELHGKTVVLKVRDVDFHTQTRRVTAENYFEDETAVAEAAWQLWVELGRLQRPVRLLGVTETALAPMSYQNIDLPLN
ncbi:DNA polymerase IV [Lacticaseibacillus zhaodongensis]|uniref:DNA polymerase IV n=1 Tax=Lacticaseibacillus zhaodongensis TaxID=2668065 RepID=UPI0022A9C879|nr:DNA polymerase IV [Lacticaseibacillus zhaodongensis]